MWLDTHLRCKWTWAGHVHIMPSERLAKRGLEWRDSLWWASELSDMPPKLRLHRDGRQRLFRWEDELKRFAAHSGWSSWQEVAQTRDCAGHATSWMEATAQFISHTRR